MSEPQQPYGTDTNAGRPAPGSAPSPVQAVPDSPAMIGARLAQLRESKGWSIEDVSARLKVSPNKLRALEAGNLSQLPDTTFALGVVRSYSKMLGTDPAPYTQALRRERGIAAPDLTMPASSGSDLPRGRVSLTLGGNETRQRSSWLWGIAAVVVAVIALAMWHTNSGDSSAWLARLKSAVNGGAASVQPGASATVAEGQTTVNPAASDAQSTDQAASQTADQGSADASATTGATADAQAGSATPAAEAPPAPQAQAPVQAPAPAQVQVQAPAAPAQPVRPASTPAVAATSAPAATSASAPAAKAPAADNSNADTSTFVIRVTQDSWVSVRDKGGKEVFSGLVHGSDAREITGVAPLKVTVGNKAGIESMTLDGQPVDVAKYSSARGNVARFVLP